MIKFTHAEIEEVVKVAVECTAGELVSLMMDATTEYEQNRLNLARMTVESVGSFILRTFNALAEEQLKSSELEDKISAIDRQLAQIAASKLRPVSPVPDQIVHTEHGTIVIDHKVGYDEPEFD